MVYRREIDGLRAIAVLPVILFHAGVSWFSGGFVGVDVFFVISGYLITSIIVAEAEAGSLSILKFYERRARRILPALFFVMLLCLPLAWLWMLPYELAEFADSLVAVPIFFSNVLFQHETGYFGGAAAYKPLLHTWSLAVEEQFYLLFPLLVLMFWRFGRTAFIALLLATIAASLALAQAGGNLHTYSPHLSATWDWWRSPPWAFYLAPTRAWELLIGSLLAVVQFDQPLRRLPHVVAELLGALGLAMILYAVFAFDRTTPDPSIYTLLPTLGAALILLAASSRTWVGRALGHPWLVGIGLISYSAYLWHQPLFAFARIRSLDEPGGPLLMSLGAAALLLAWATWRFIERPFRDRAVVSRQTVFASAFAMSAAMIGGGLVGHLTHGFESRSALARLDDFSGMDLGCSFPTQGYRQLLCDELLRPAARDSDRKILFIGDSLLVASVDGIREAAKQLHVEVNVAPKWGCPALIGVTRMLDGKPYEDCEVFTHKVYEMVREQRVSDVVLFVAFNRYLRHSRFPGNDMDAGVKDPARSCHSRDACIAQTSGALTATLAKLRDSGVRVWVVRQPPDYSIEYAADNLNKRYLFGGDAAVRMSRRDYAEDSAEFFRAVHGTGAEVFDLTNQLCDAQYCRPLIDGQMVYADNDHFGRNGAVKLLPQWEFLLRDVVASGPRG